MAEKKENVFGLSSEDPDQEAPAFSVPPPAKPVPGVTGNPPLPPGKPVGVDLQSTGLTADDYTEEELQTLRTIPGWEPGMPIPDNLQQILAEVAHEARGDTTDPNKIPLPVRADTPPLRVPEPVDIGQLPPDKQQEILAGLDRAQAAAQAAAEPDSMIDSAGPGVNEAISGQGVREVQVINDTGQDTYAGTDVPQGPPPTPPSGMDQPAGSRTGAQDPLIGECPHCGWDLKEPDPIQPEIADKQRYLVAISGGIGYQKPYELFGGKMTLIVRELMPDEVDQIFKEVWHQRSQGKINTPQEFFELSTRYRVCLQLVSLVTADTSNTFPENLGEWGGTIGKGQVTVLPGILGQVYEKALKTESLLRVITKVVGNFNRLVAKLEDNWHRPDFWEGTEQAGQ